jgi:DNA-directed RNA polymerase I, II, and III subunit RPABC4
MSSPQREAYQLPSQRESQSGSTNQQTTSYTTSYGIQAGDSSAGPQVQYICGECNHKVSLGRGDAIRCKECGHRVLYKERTKRYVMAQKRIRLARAVVLTGGIDTVDMARAII